MGYERKRGKLARAQRAAARRRDRALRAGRRRNRRCCAACEYVITLDTDTQLPRDAARQLVGAMAHPLNRPRFDDATRRVTRATASCSRASASACRAPAGRAMRGCSAASPASIRTRAPSPTCTRICSAKARSSARASTTSMRSSARSSGRFPENRILSHDLLEGCYARAGPAERRASCTRSIPSRYGADVSRRHRWIRGDWQIARWLLAARAGDGGEPQRNPLSRLSRWKIFDNLRRSLVPAGAGWLLLFAGWPAVALLADRAVVPAVAGARCCELLRKPADVPLRRHLAAALRSAGAPPARRRRSRSPACRTRRSSASTRSLRTPGGCSSRARRLLEWTPSSEASASGTSSSAPIAAMWIAPGRSRIAAALLAGALERRPRWRSPRRSSSLWLASPGHRVVDQPAARAPRGAADARSRSLSCARLARKTWAFFETFVGAGGPLAAAGQLSRSIRSPVVAHRTSPTNMGLALLANLAAYDFGYLTAGQLIERTDAGARHACRRWSGTAATSTTGTTRGRSKPLPPLYVSTVDSGNLAGHLLTLRPGLLALADAPHPGAALLRGPARHARDAGRRRDGARGADARSAVAACAPPARRR